MTWTDSVRFGLSALDKVNGAEGLMYPAARAKENKKEAGYLALICWTLGQCKQQRLRGLTVDRGGGEERRGGY